MYIEISSRQSGKTNRMLERMKELSYNNKEMKYFHLFTHNRQQFAYLMKKIKLWPKMFHTNYQIIQGEIARNVDFNVDHNYIFADEFDFNHKLDNRHISEHGYYCTTPSKMRVIDDFLSLNSSDFLINLLQANDGYYVSHNHFRLAHLTTFTNIEEKEVCGSFIAPIHGISVPEFEKLHKKAELIKKLRKI